MILDRPTLCAALVVASFIACPPGAVAAPSAATPEMQKALAAADKGPDELRPFIHRTRMIYQLSYYDVMQQRAAQNVAGTEQWVASSTQPDKK